MLPRKIVDWRIVAALVVSFFIFVSIHLSVPPLNPQGHTIRRFSAKNTNTQPGEGDEISDSIIEIETLNFDNGGAKTVISVQGKANNVHRLTEPIIDKIREIMSNDANDQVEEIIDDIKLNTTEQNTDETQPTKTMEENVGITNTTDQILAGLEPSDETVVLPETLKKLREKLKCFDKSFESRVSQRGDYWVFTNYIRAEHGPLGCHEELTLTIHSDFTFLDNLDPLIERWNGPVSVAIHTPGTDLTPTIDTMRYMRDCSHNANLVRKWVTFHLFFHKDHIPEQIPRLDELLANQYNCSLLAPYSVNASSLYSANNSLLYPVNVARNVAREAALTHFVFPVDIELYPTPRLGARFLNMIARDPPQLAGIDPRVFPLALFEVEEGQKVPMNKNELLGMLKTNKAIPFHKFVCAQCHNVPMFEEWKSQNDTGQLNVFTVAKRTEKHHAWEPIFIGTNQEPMYEERMSWEGKGDKMSQSYIMCVQDYNYVLLNDAFLVHRPGIKIYEPEKKRDDIAIEAYSLLHNTIAKELKTVYGTREGCNL